MSKKAVFLLVLTMILLFLTGYNISKRIRMNREQPANQSYSQRIDAASLAALPDCIGVEL